MVSIPDYQTTEEGRQYEKQVTLVLQGEKKDYPSYFGGLKVASGTTFTVPSPVDESIIFGIFQEPEPHIMVEAVTAAVDAQKSWAQVPVDERAAYFEKALKVLKARPDYYAAVLTVACGMVREDAVAEVSAAIEMIEKAVRDSEGFSGRPVGVWAVLSAHNSPFATPVACSVAAMIAGNSVVMCPSKHCPTPVYMFYGLMERYGLPAGVLNLIVDDKDDSTEELANDMRVAGVVATGSGDRLEDLMFLQVDDELKFINEIKGMNPAIVYRPSDMKSAVRDVITSAFSYSGQRIHSCSKVIITEDDRRRFTEILIEQMKDLRIGDPIDDTTQIGPVISRDAVKRFGEIMDDHIPYVLARTAPAVGAPGDGYLSPVAVSGLDEDDDLSYMDSGLPVLNVKVVGTLDEAFQELEDTECGQSAGLFTRDASVIARFESEVDVPQKFINVSSRTLKPASAAVLGNFVR